MIPKQTRGVTRRALLAAPLLLAAAPPSPPEPPMRLLVLGDSQAQGLAAGLQRAFRADRTMRVLDHSRIGSGLITRQGYEWPVQARAIAQDEKADLALVMFGANDRPPVRANGQVSPKLLAAFRDSYGAHVRDLVAGVRASGAAVIWIGHPIVREAEFTEDMRLLNELFQANATAAGAEFVPSWDMFVDAEGAYSAYGPGLDGSTTRLRADDGVHLTPAGYDLIARALRPRIAAHRGAAPVAGPEAAMPAETPEPAAPPPEPDTAQ